MADASQNDRPTADRSEAVIPKADFETVHRMLWQEFESLYVDPASGKVRTDLLADRPCPLCGAAPSSAPMFEKHGLAFHRCHCGMVFISPLLRTEIRRQWYANSKAYAWFWREMVARSREARIANVWRPRLAMLRAQGCDFTSVLDVGCGSGDFVALVLQEENGTIIGVEPGEQAFRTAEAVAKGAVRLGALESMDFTPGSFSLITLWEVFHHFDDPNAAMRRLFDLLRPGGQLVLQSPNIEGFDYAVLGPHHHDVQFGIPNYFSIATIDRVLTSAGFRAEDIDISTPGRLDVEYVNRAMGRHGSDIVADPFLRTVLSRTAEGDNELATDLQTCLRTHDLSGSMLVIARKQA